LRKEGIAHFENWKPAPKYTSDGTGTGDLPKESDDEEGEQPKPGKKAKKEPAKLSATMSLQRNFSLPQL
jgi:hypothetical protein